MKIVVKYDFEIYAAYIDENSFRDTASIIDKEKLYNWTIKELLVIMPIADAKIKIDGRSSRQNMRRAATYLRREANKDGDKKIEILFEDSVDNDLIQLADLIAGAINRSMNIKKQIPGYILIL